MVYIVDMEEEDGTAPSFSYEKIIKKSIDIHKNIVYYVPSTPIHTKKGAIYGVFRKYTNLSAGCGRD